VGRDLLERAGRAVRLEEQRAAAVVVAKQDLIGQPHLDGHAEHAGVEPLGTVELGNVNAEVIEPPDPHASRIACHGPAARRTCQTA
jgi:hypothetical protein